MVLVAAVLGVVIVAPAAAATALARVAQKDVAGTAVAQGVDATPDAARPVPPGPPSRDMFFKHMN